MSAGQLWIRIYGAGFILCFVVFAITLLTPIQYGDVTRVGRISETEFASRHGPPKIAANDLEAVPIYQADVLVIGDSFSIRFAWQSALVHAGYKVVTTHWDKTGPLCYADFPQWLARSGFKGRFVVIESIERLLPERLELAAACTSMTLPFQPIPRADLPSAESAIRPWLGLNWTAEWSNGLLTYLNTRAIKATRTPLTFTDPRWGDLIVAHPLPKGCRQFSNRLCNKGLFLVDDERNPVLNPNAANFMKRFSDHVEPVKVIWMVIPNKTTVYIEPGHAEGFVKSLDALALGPDLFAFAAKAHRTVPDLYAPNDTHLSLDGYLAFGERMLRAVKEAQP
jgi:hypothetical protein